MGPRPRVVPRCDVVGEGVVAGANVVIRGPYGAPAGPGGGPARRSKSALRELLREFTRPLRLARHTPPPPRALGPWADLWPRRPELWSSNIGRQLGRRANVSGEALGWVRQRSHRPRSSPRRSTHGP